MTVPRHQELSDDQIESASIEDLRAAYRSLRAHHVAETTALIARRDDIDRLGSENARLTEIIDFMQNHYSPIGGRGCALCVYVEGRFVRPCALHRWSLDLDLWFTERGDTAAKVLASRATDPDKLLTARNLFDRAADPAVRDHLSDKDLTAWAERAGVYEASMEGSCLRAIVDELHERRDAEALFAEVDRQFQEVDCRTCDDEGADHCEAHKLLVRQWRSTRAALCDLARIHRAYLRSLNAPNGGDP